MLLEGCRWFFIRERERKVVVVVCTDFYGLVLGIGRGDGVDRSTEEENRQCISDE